MSDSTQDRWVVMDARKGAPTDVPVWVLSADTLLDSTGLRAHAAALSASGEVDGELVERMYETAEAMDEWAGQHTVSALPQVPAAALDPETAQ